MKKHVRRKRALSDEDREPAPPSTANPGASDSGPAVAQGKTGGKRKKKKGKASLLLSFGDDEDGEDGGALSFVSKKKPRAQALPPPTTSVEEAAGTSCASGTGDAANTNGANAYSAESMQALRSAQ